MFNLAFWRSSNKTIPVKEIGTYTIGTDNEEVNNYLRDLVNTRSCIVNGIVVVYEIGSNLNSGDVKIFNASLMKEGMVYNATSKLLEKLHSHSRLYRNAYFWFEYYIRYYDGKPLDVKLPSVCDFYRINGLSVDDIYYNETYNIDGKYRKETKEIKELKYLLDLKLILYSLLGDRYKYKVDRKLKEETDYPTLKENIKEYFYEPSYTNVSGTFQKANHKYSSHVIYDEKEYKRNYAEYCKFDKRINKLKEQCEHEFLPSFLQEVYDVSQCFDLCSIMDMYDKLVVNGISVHKDKTPRGIVRLRNINIEQLRERYKEMVEINKASLRLQREANKIVEKYKGQSDDKQNDIGILSDLYSSSVSKPKSISMEEVYNPISLDKDITALELKDAKEDRLHELEKWYNSYKNTPVVFGDNSWSVNDEGEAMIRIRIQLQKHADYYPFSIPDYHGNWLPKPRMSKLRILLKRIHLEREKREEMYLSIVKRIKQAKTIDEVKSVMFTNTKITEDPQTEDIDELSAEMVGNRIVRVGRNNKVDSDSRKDNAVYSEIGVVIEKSDKDPNKLVVEVYMSIRMVRVKVLWYQHNTSNKAPSVRVGDKVEVWTPHSYGDERDVFYWDVSNIQFSIHDVIRHSNKLLEKPKIEVTVDTHTGTYRH